MTLLNGWGRCVVDFEGQGGDVSPHFRGHPVVPVECDGITLGRI